jgi:hypothetical protein
MAIRIQLSMHYPVPLQVLSFKGSLAWLDDALPYRFLIGRILFIMQRESDLNETCLSSRSKDLLSRGTLSEE